jgi:hypothetical protein
MEIEALQAKISLHNDTKNAWDTILRNSASELHGVYRDLAKTETERLNGEIEGVEEEIRHHIEARDAWDTVVRNAACELHLEPSVPYVKGEDGQWHLQRLDREMDALKGRISLHNETKDAWDTIIRNAAGESQPSYLDLAINETARLNKEIETVHEKIRRHQETRNAWDTIMRNAMVESRVFQGATYLKGWDGQWHLQRTQEREANVEDFLRVVEDDRRWSGNAVSKVNSVRLALLDACEKTFRTSPKEVNITAHGKEQFQSLGLR